MSTRMNFKTAFLIVFVGIAFTVNGQEHVMKRNARKRFHWADFFLKDREMNQWSNPWMKLPDYNCFKDSCRTSEDCCQQYNICNTQGTCQDCWKYYPCTYSSECCEDYPICDFSRGYGRCIKDHHTKY